MTSHLGDRRGEPRLAPRMRKGRIGWYEGEQFRQAEAALVNVSQGGAELVADAAPAPEVPVCLFIEGIGLDRWLDADVVSGRRDGWRSRRLHLAFREPIPYDAYKAAVYGPPEAAQSPAWRA